MKMIDHNHFICHLILGTFTEYPEVRQEDLRADATVFYKSLLRWHPLLFLLFYKKSSGSRRALNFSCRMAVNGL